MSYLGLEIATPADDSVTSAKIVDGAILNVDVNASAAIAQSKLSLDIVNANINASAAIAQSKLSLDIANANINASAAIDATKIADGSVTSTEFQYINTLSSNAQTQIDAKGVGDALLGTAQIWTAGQRGEITALTSATSVTIDMANSNNFSCTMAHNVVFENPSNDTAGQCGSIFLTQDGTGSRTASWGSDWDFAGGTVPTLTTTAAAVDRIDYVILDATNIQAVATLNYS
jgi:hypothetical protein